jgi:uncharacterized membrane protein YdcZ (DUF606 family)
MNNIAERRPRAPGLAILPLAILLDVFGASMLSMTAWNWIRLLVAALAVLGWVLARRRSAAVRSK